jgi:hypothetical protein
MACCSQMQNVNSSDNTGQAAMVQRRKYTEMFSQSNEADSALYTHAEPHRITILRCIDYAFSARHFWRVAESLIRRGDSLLMIVVEGAKAVGQTRHMLLMRSDGRDRPRAVAFAAAPLP